MSSIEERLARDVAAVRGGVVVTESHLYEARTELHQRIDSASRRDRRRAVAAAAAAAVVLGAVGITASLALGDDPDTTRLAGPGASPSNAVAAPPSGSAPTIALISGIWRLDNGETTVKFDAKGDVRFDEHGTLFSDPVTTGTYAIDGDLITVTTTGDKQTGCVGTETAMRVSLSEPGELQFIQSDTIPGACSPLPSQRGGLNRLLPTSRGMAELVFSKDTGWQPLSDKTTLLGLWLAEGGGHVLEMDRDGTYFIADESADPIDTGQWSVSGADLTLTSSARSNRCSVGDRYVLGTVEWNKPGTRAFRGTVKQNTCGGAWTPAVWILAPNTGS
ncbi:MAG TPA: hypothetical protein VNB94_00400 [Mycobacteriales bacterium]|nr:hypothetical protein [Mycobacteriales bacterium]